MHLMLQNPLVRNEKMVENSDFLGEVQRGCLWELRQTEHGPAEVQSHTSPFWFPTPTSVGGSPFKQPFQNVGKHQRPV